MRTTSMRGPSRRSVLRASLGAAGSFTLACPFIASAAAKTATVWWVQGFVPEEDAAFQEMVAAYEKQSGNKIDYSIIPFAPQRQKTISAITSGVVPDLMNATPPEVVPLQSWENRLVDVTDVVETQKSKMLPIASASAYCYTRPRTGAATTPCLTQARWFHSMSGAPLSRRPATRSRTAPTSGMPSSISSSRCRRS
jgi:hypothetical protein